MEAPVRHLVFHASLVLLIGLLYGAPYGRAITRNASAQAVNSWRVAHQSITLGAILMFALAWPLAMLAVGSQMKWLIVISLVVSAYAFCISTPLAAITGDRGLSGSGKGWARLAHWGNTVGAGSSLIASVLLVYAGWVTL